MTPTRSMVSAKQIVKEWEAKGGHLDIPGTAGTRIWREGEGETVVLLHGVPSSAYLYRKVLPELAKRGLTGVALDLQGLGFSDRPHPNDFDYTWTGLSAWLEKALDAAGIDKFHFVVHDIGGPVGFDLIRRLQGSGRILSLTVLNTLVNVATFKKPMVMQPFSVPIIGKLWTMQMNSPAIVPFFRLQGVNKTATWSEIRAYGHILSRGDGGKAFRKIMSSFETTQEFQDRIVTALKKRDYPAQIIWGKDDTALKVDSFAKDIKDVLGLQTEIHQVEGKHFLQEDSYVEIADRVAQLVDSGKDI